MKLRVRMPCNALMAGRPTDLRVDAQRNSMKLKLDDQGKPVFDGNNPVFTDAEGKDSAIDVAGILSSVRARNAEAKQNRERYEAAEAKLKAYEGLDDPEAARKALQTIQNLDQKKLVDAGQVETVKAEINKVWGEKYEKLEKSNKELMQQIYDEKIGGSFARSKFIAEKLTLPSDLAQSAFGKHFKLEEGKTRAYDAHGNLIHSKKNPGEPADFDEAIEILVDQYPRKDSILKPTQVSGSGAPVGGSQGRATKDLSNLTPQQRLVAAREMKT